MCGVLSIVWEGEGSTRMVLFVFRCCFDIGRFYVLGNKFVLIENWRCSIIEEIISAEFYIYGFRLFC